MKVSHVKPLWWDVVEAMAELVLLGQDESDLTSETTIRYLQLLDFRDDEIDNACNFIEKAQISGTLSETLSMLGPQIEGVRVPHPKENFCFSTKVWRQIEKCRQKGLLSLDVSERLLEGARLVEDRDWDDDDISSFLLEFMSASSTGQIREDKFLQLLKSGAPEFYC